MPRYFFDASDGELSVVDDTGLVLEGEQAARSAALDALSDMARDRLPDGDRRSVSVTVRNEENRQIFRASLTLKAEILE